MNRPSYKELLFDERKDREEQLRWIKDAVNGSAKFYREPPYSYEEELAREIMQMHVRIAELENEHAVWLVGATNEIDRLNARIAELEAELKITDELLKEATETIGAVVACCTYNSNDDAKIGIYGIDQKAFTRIDQFITHYNDAVSAGKVSVDVKPVKRENDYQNDNRTNTGG